jgi:hypothetical protein
MSRSFDAALKNIDRIFPTPGSIVVSAELSREEKIKLLREWDYDLRLELVAMEENMTGTDAPGENSERLRQIGESLEQLGYVRDESQGGPSKTGA